jgi:hypothetical protein
VSTVAVVVLASLITALITTIGGWAVNQLPALKSHVSAQVRVDLVIALTVIAGLTAAGISVASSKASTRRIGHCSGARRTGQFTFDFVLRRSGPEFVGGPRQYDRQVGRDHRLSA